MSPRTIEAWRNAVIRAWEDGDVAALAVLAYYDPRRI
jgi:hypothetical protein